MMIIPFAQGPLSQGDIAPRYDAAVAAASRGADVVEALPGPLVAQLGGLTVELAAVLDQVVTAFLPRFAAETVAPLAGLLEQVIAALAEPLAADAGAGATPNPARSASDAPAALPVRARDATEVRTQGGGAQAAPVFADPLSLFLALTMSQRAGLALPAGMSAAIGSINASLVQAQAATTAAQKGGRPDLDIPQALLARAGNPWSVLVDAYAAAGLRTDAPPSTRSSSDSAALPFFAIGQVPAGTIATLHEALADQAGSDMAAWQLGQRRFVHDLDANDREAVSLFRFGSPNHALLCHDVSAPALAALEPSAFWHALAGTARFAAVLRRAPMLPAGMVLRRGVTDDAAMLRFARTLAIGSIFQELALVAAARFPEFGESTDSFLLRKLSSEIIVARGVRGIEQDRAQAAASESASESGRPPMIALSPDTRFLLAARLTKPDGGVHLIVFAFGAEKLDGGDRAPPAPVSSGPRRRLPRRALPSR